MCGEYVAPSLGRVTVGELAADGRRGRNTRPRRLTIGCWSRMACARRLALGVGTGVATLTRIAAEGYIECRPLVPKRLICSNCHTMIHRPNPRLTPEQVRTNHGKFLTIQSWPVHAEHVLREEGIIIMEVAFRAW